MFGFMLTASIGAVLSGSYVLLRTPRTGKENREFVKEYYHATKGNVENVQDKFSTVQASVNNLKVEVAKLQTGPLPEIMHLADDFKTEAQVYSRRINDGVDVIKQEVETMQNRIERKTDDLPVEQITQDTNSENE